MPDETKKITVQFTPEFKRNLRTLAKKYRHIRNDIEPVIAQLQNGHLLGNQVPGSVIQYLKCV
jgi:mRNA-degrading endonuclease RelE of RelBE toxin-antitoxin system